MEIFDRLRNIQDVYKTELFRLMNEWVKLKNKFSYEYQASYYQ